jgi:hypothetical protein
LCFHINSTPKARFFHKKLSNFSKNAILCFYQKNANFIQLSLKTNQNKKYLLLIGMVNANKTLYW